MRAISEQIYSHLSMDGGRNQRTSVRDVRLDGGLFINNYSDLVKAVASISYNNPDYNLYFRGQTNEYQQQLKKKRTGLYMLSIHLQRLGARRGQERSKESLVRTT